MRSINTPVTAAAGAEVISDAFTSPEDKPRHVNHLAVEVIADVILRGYKAQDRILEVSLDCDVSAAQYIPVDEPIPVGETWKVGLLNNSGASVTINITTFYTE